MKLYEKHQAIKLRKGGMAMGEIAKKLGVAKSSVSYWVRDIKLTAKQKAKLNNNGHSVEAIEKRRAARIKNTQNRHDLIRRAATTELPERLQNPLWCIGVSLYWGEGGKTQQTARLANSDPRIIKVMMRFFRECCGVAEEKFRGHVHTFSHQNVNQTELFWSKVSGIPTKRFYKTYVKQSSASKQKRDTLPYGTFQIYVHDTEVFLRITAWMNELAEQFQ